jgi:plasmid stabilization system protein ParE
MAQRKIIWSRRATIKLYSILEFYILRNKSKTYSTKLYTKINKEIRLLHNNPDLGIKTTDETIRGLIVESYIIYYQVTENEIIIHSIWDSRQNPESKIIK